MTAARILIVENDVMIGILLAELLREMGYEVCGIACTETEAITAAAQCRPDLMIVDVWLDDGDGVSAIAEILRTGPMPHVFVSGDVAGILAVHPKLKVMQKPFREQELAQAIGRALGAASPT